MNSVMPSPRQQIYSSEGRYNVMVGQMGHMSHWNTQERGRSGLGAQFGTRMSNEPIAVTQSQPNIDYASLR
jgi:hypothetical protein